VLRALLLQAFYSIRSERQLVEQIDYNLLFRWFVGLGMDDAVWNHAVFSKNRDRLLKSEVAQRFFAAVNQQAKRFMSDDHFTVDGTLIQAWASHKSFRPKDGSDDDEPRAPSAGSPSAPVLSRACSLLAGSVPESPCVDFDLASSAPCSCEMGSCGIFAARRPSSSIA
jgi:hypothetical protein